MKRSKFLSAFALFTLLGELAYAGFNLMGVPQIAAMQLRTDGGYDVLCTDKAREIVSVQDIFSNNACPRKTSELGILSMSQTPEGHFAVICKDQSHVTAEPADIVAGKVCTEKKSGHIINGIYHPKSERMCDQSLVATYDKDLLQKITLGFLAPCNTDDGIVVDCHDSNNCKGTHSGTGQIIEVTVLDEQHFHWKNLSTGTESVFAYVANGRPVMMRIVNATLTDPRIPAGSIPLK